MTWHAAYTSIRLEKRAERGLREIGIEAYVPVEKHDRRHARKVDTVERVIFPRYLFFRSADFYAVRKVYGIESIVGFCGVPASIPYEWVHEIRESERAGFFDYTHKQVNFAKNDPVRITGGPFSGMLATIMQAKPGEARVTILLQALGRLRGGKMKIATAELEKVA